jgi:hypothetical protein
MQSHTPRDVKITVIPIEDEEMTGASRTNPPVFYHDEGEKNALKLAEVYQQLKELRDNVNADMSGQGMTSARLVAIRLNFIMDRIANGGQHA